MAILFNKLKIALKIEAKFTTIQVYWSMWLKNRTAHWCRSSSCHQCNIRPPPYYFLLLGVGQLSHSLTDNWTILLNDWNFHKNKSSKDLRYRLILTHYIYTTHQYTKSNLYWQRYILLLSLNLWVVDFQWPPTS